MGDIVSFDISLKINKNFCLGLKHIYMLEDFQHTSKAPSVPDIAQWSGSLWDIYVVVLACDCVACSGSKISPE